MRRLHIPGRLCASPCATQTSGCPSTTPGLPQRRSLAVSLSLPRTGTTTTYLDSTSYESDRAFDTETSERRSQASSVVRVQWTDQESAPPDIRQPRAGLRCYRSGLLSLGRDRAIPTGYQAGGSSPAGASGGPGRVGRFEQPIDLSSA